jgi:hypothetical protein
MEITYYSTGYNKLCVCFREWLLDDRKYPRKYYFNKSGEAIRVAEGDVVPDECNFHITGDPSAGVVEMFEDAVIFLAEKIKEENPDVIKRINEKMHPMSGTDVNSVLKKFNENHKPWEG